MSQKDQADLDVRIIGPDQRDPGTAQTPGLQRFAAVLDGKAPEPEAVARLHGAIDAVRRAS